MDTGSTGIVVSPDQLGLTQAQALALTSAPGAALGSVTYSSSGIVNNGAWIQTSVNMLATTNPTAATLATANVPVLLVTNQGCLATPVTCTPSTAPTGLAMMGVGFGRNADGQPQAMPRVNPLLNIVSIGNGATAQAIGTVSATPGGTPIWANSGAVGGSTYSLTNAAYNIGYVVTPTGVQLGLTQQNTAGGSFIQLTPNVGTPASAAPAVQGDWAMARAGLTLTGTGIPPITGVGQSLADTGVREMILVQPAVTSLAPTPNLTVDLGGAGLVGYSLNPNNPQPGPNSPNPDEVQFRTVPGQGPFVNTGRNILNNFQLVFDARNGYIGYIPVANVSNSNVFFTQGVGIQGGITLPGGFTSTVPVVLLDQTMLSTSGTARFTGTMSGNSFGASQGLMLGGGGVFQFSGAGSYTGGTVVSGATLQLQSGNEIGSGALVLQGGTLGAMGTVNLPNAIQFSGTGGTVTPNSQAITLSGVISNALSIPPGQQGLTISGPGTVTLTNTANSYAGGTLVQNGAVLAISSDSQLGATTGGLTLNNGTLRALTSFTSARNVAIGSAGGTFDTGSGNIITLLGNYVHTGAVQIRGTGQVNHTGTVMVSSGTLTVHSAVAAPSLLVAAGATLSGNGTVNSPTTISGNASPGSSPGILTFTAPVTMGPNARLLVDVDGPGVGIGPGNTDQIRVLGSGNGFAANGTIVPITQGIVGGASNSYIPPLGQAFTIIQADGGVSGSFTAIAQPTTGMAPGTRFDAVYGSNTVRLVVTPAAYGNLAAAGIRQTANIVAIGTALDAIRPAAGLRPGDALGQGFANLYQTAPGQLGSAINALSGQTWGDALSARLEVGRGFGSAMMEQLAAARGTAASAQMARAGENVAWLRATGQPMLRMGGDGNASGFTSSGAGVAVGIERALSPQFRLGFASGYASNTVSPRQPGKVDSESVFFGLYGGWAGPQGIFADADISGGWAQDRVRRNLAPAGATASGTADGSSFSAAIRLGVVRPYAGFVLEPSIGFRYARVNGGSANEQGAAGGLNLNVASSSLESARMVTGIVARRAIPGGDGITITPSLRVAYAREMADARAVTTTAFQALPSQAYRVASAAPGRDAVLLGAGVAVQFRPNMTVFADYVADLRSNFTAQAISAGLRFSF